MPSKSLHINPTFVTPSVNFDLSANEFSIDGKSILMDVDEFYAPLLEWLENFASSHNEPVEFSFRVTHCNLPSAKILMLMVYILNTMHKRANNLHVIWHYCMEDEGMQELGEELQSLFGMHIRLQPYHMYSLSIAS